MVCMPPASNTCAAAERELNVGRWRATGVCGWRGLAIRGRAPCARGAHVGRLRLADVDVKHGDAVGCLVQILCRVPARRRRGIARSFGGAGEAAGTASRVRGAFEPVRCARAVEGARDRVEAEDHLARPGRLGRFLGLAQQRRRLAAVDAEDRAVGRGLALLRVLRLVARHRVAAVLLELVERDALVVRVAGLRHALARHLHRCACRGERESLLGPAGTKLRPEAWS